jgi:hypothetical protein
MKYVAWFVGLLLLVIGVQLLLIFGLDKNARDVMWWLRPIMPILAGLIVLWGIAERTVGRKRPQREK